MKNLLSIWCGHDANASFYNSESDTYHIIELERIVKKRYFRLHADNNENQTDEILDQVKNISEKFFNIKNKYDLVSSPQEGYIYFPNLIKKHFNTTKYAHIANHHDAHAYAAFYQSPFDKSIIFSYDGGGNDGFFNVYKAENNTIEKIKNINADFGGTYMLFASCLKEISERSKNQLSLPGKLMGLCAYGEPIIDYIPDLIEAFTDKNKQTLKYREINEKFNLKLQNTNDPWKHILNNWVFEGQQSYNFAATIQAAFEKAFFKIFEEIMINYKNYPVCITGGAALNVLVNQKIKDNYNINVFVPPNPNDCGLSIGELLIINKPKNKIKITYDGVPLLDKNKLHEYAISRNAEQCDLKKIAYLLKQGKIIGICNDNSEVGPRALGNRSIVCDPSFLNMKDVLNSKVKFREWYRPFAPFCKKENAYKYFESSNFENMEYMGFAPKVKRDKMKLLPSITHVDGTARLQTVTNESHKLFYQLLTEFEMISENSVLLNTSFNILGKPILTTIEDALHVLDTTELDYVYSHGFLFKKDLSK
jgi:carbamoyltransferase